MNKIHPIGDNILIKLDEAIAGVLDTSSRSTMVENGIVVAVGEKVTLPLKKGDKVIFKSWACDNTEYEGVKYYFVGQETGGIKAIIKG